MLMCCFTVLIITYYFDPGQHFVLNEIMSCISSVYIHEFLIEFYDCLLPDMFFKKSCSLTTFPSNFINLKNEKFRKNPSRRLI